MCWYRRTVPFLALASLALSGFCGVQTSESAAAARLRSSGGSTAAVDAGILAQALPAGATEIAAPVGVRLRSLGEVGVVLFRRNAADPMFRAAVLMSPSGGTLRTVLLPDPTPEQRLGEPIESGADSPRFEEIATSILGVDLGPTVSQRGRRSEDAAPNDRTDRSASRPAPLHPMIPSQGSHNDQRALVILFYTHRFGQTESSAFGRVYLYENGAFHIDGLRSRLLDGVRTAAVARLRLAGPP